MASGQDIYIDAKDPFLDATVAPRTIREWMNELPSDIRRAAIKNAMTAHAEINKITGKILIDSSKKDSFAEALFAAFVFSATPEGFKFWNDIAVKYSSKITQK